MGIRIDLIGEFRGGDDGPEAWLSGVASWSNRQARTLKKRPASGFSPSLGTPRTLVVRSRSGPTRSIPPSPPARLSFHFACDPPNEASSGWTRFPTGC
jgi:hypothetical protein